MFPVTKNQRETEVYESCSSREKWYTFNLTTHPCLVMECLIIIKSIRMTGEISKVSVNGLSKIYTYKQFQFRKEK